MTQLCSGHSSVLMWSNLDPPAAIPSIEHSQPGVALPEVVKRDWNITSPSEFDDAVVLALFPLPITLAFNVPGALRNGSGEVR